jgi:TonB family protein
VRAAEPSGSTLDPAIEKKLDGAQELFDKKKFKQAAAELRQADQLAKGQCGACLLWLAHAEVALGDRERAVQAARAALALGGPQPFMAVAYKQLAVSLIQPQADEFKLAEAEVSLRRAVELGDSMARVHLAALQLRRHHPGKALALARYYLAAEPRGKGAEAAHILVCHARAVLAEGTPSGNLAGVGDEPRVVSPGSGIAPPKTLYRQPPQLVEGVTGAVQLDSVVDEEGCVIEARVPERGRAPALEVPALQAVRYWVFQPATYQGQPVRVKYPVRFDSRESYSPSGHPGIPIYQSPFPGPHVFTPEDIAHIRGTYEKPGPPR